MYKTLIFLLATFLILTFNSFFIEAQNKKLFSAAINSPTALESAPCISFDGEIIVYMSDKSGIWRLYESHLLNADANEWSEPNLIEFEGVQFDENHSIKHPSLNHDGNGLYFAANFSDSEGSMDIYFSQRKNNIWQKPINLGKKINSEFSEQSPAISSNDNYIYFVRRNLNSEIDNKACSSIFYSKKIDNVWSEPVPLSSPINLDCENYPYIAADNKTLYFSSIREGGIGNYDIYMTKMLAENIWYLPVSIASINSELDELYPSYSTLTKELVFSLAQNEKNSVQADIYSVMVFEANRPDDAFIYKGSITDALTKEPLHAKLLIRNKNNFKLISEFETDAKTGNFTIIFSKWKNYEIEVYKENYSHVFFHVNTNNYKDIDALTYLDISLFNKTKLILNIFDEEIFEPLESKILVKKSDASNLADNLINYVTQGRIEIELAIGDVYNILIEKVHYENYQFEFDLSGIIQFSEFEKDVELIPMKTEFVINIADIETDDAIDEVEIIITNLEKNETIVKKVRRGENGKFTVNLRDGDKYEINVNGPKGYAFYNTKIDMADDKANKKLDVKLQPLTAKTKLVLNNITFETNSAELNKSSFEELNRVVKLLFDNPEIKIEISAHTDDLGSANYNQKLSDKRAESVVQYLTDNDLPPKRLIAKGYGETAPVSANDSEENRAKNRRVELKIIE